MSSLFTGFRSGKTSVKAIKAHGFLHLHTPDYAVQRPRLKLHVEYNKKKTTNIGSSRSPPTRYHPSRINGTCIAEDYTKPHLNARCFLSFSCSCATYELEASGHYRDDSRDKSLFVKQRKLTSLKLYEAILALYTCSVRENNTQGCRSSHWRAAHL